MAILQRAASPTCFPPFKEMQPCLLVEDEMERVYAHFIYAKINNNNKYIYRFILKKYIVYVYIKTPHTPPPPPPPFTLYLILQWESISLSTLCYGSVTQEIIGTGGRIYVGVDNIFSLHSRTTPAFIDCLWSTKKIPQSRAVAFCTLVNDNRDPVAADTP